MRFRVAPTPTRLAILFGAGLLAAGGPLESGADVEPPRTPPDFPLELIAPGRTLTVIVPSRDAEVRHAGADVPPEPTQRHRVLVRRFAEQHYLDVDWVQVDDWDALVPTLLAGKGDLVAADVVVTDLRKEMLAFTVPTHRTRELIVVRKGDRIDTVADLVGREVALRERSSFWHVVQRARRDHPEIETRLVPENTPPEKLLKDVADGRLDMAAVDVGEGEGFESRWPTLRIVTRPFASDTTAWAVNPHAPRLREELDQFLSREQLTRLAHGERYGDLSEIRRHGVLRIVTRNSAATFYLWRGEQLGFEYELLREFAKRHRLHVEVVIAPQHTSLFEMLLRGAGDVAAASLPVDMPRRTPGVAMTRPFNYVYDQLVARHDDDTILGFEDLTGRTVTVRRSSTHWRTLERLRDAGLKLDIDPAPEDAETETLIAAVGEGRLDLTVAASHVLDIELGYRTDVRKAFTLRGPVPLGWAVRAGNRELLAALDEFLAEGVPGALLQRRLPEVLRESGADAAPQRGARRSRGRRRALALRRVGAARGREARLRLAADRRADVPGEPVPPKGPIARRRHRPDADAAADGPRVRGQEPARPGAVDPGRRRLSRLAALPGSSPSSPSGIGSGSRSPRTTPGSDTCATRASSPPASASTPTAGSTTSRRQCCCSPSGATTARPPTATCGVARSSSTSARSASGTGRICRSPTCGGKSG